MTAVWVTIAVLAVGTFTSKAVGTLVLGGRDLPARALDVTALLAPALLAGLVIYETFGTDDGLAVDARAAGLVAAILAILARLPMFAVMLIAAAVAASLRAFS
jgi:branched-subunit amino acid transport protein